MARETASSHVIDAVRTPSAELGEKIRCVNTLVTP